MVSILQNGSHQLPVVCFSYGVASATPTCERMLHILRLAFGLRLIYETVLVSWIEMLWCVLIGPCQSNQVAVVSIRLFFKLRVVFSKKVYI